MMKQNAQGMNGMPCTMKDYMQASLNHQHQQGNEVQSPVRDCVCCHCVRGPRPLGENPTRRMPSEKSKRSAVQCSSSGSVAREDSPQMQQLKPVTLFHICPTMCGSYSPVKWKFCKYMACMDACVCTQRFNRNFYMYANIYFAVLTIS